METAHRTLMKAQDKYDDIKKKCHVKRESF